jgi:hypothetical protein
MGRRLHHQREPHPLKTPAGYVVLYAAIDDATRLGYTEQLGDERGETAADFLVRACGFFTEQGIQTQRILTDTAARSDRTPGLPRVPGCALGTCDPIGRRPTAKWSASPARPATSACMHMTSALTRNEPWR